MANLKDPSGEATRGSAKEALERNVGYALKRGPTPLREIAAAEAAGQRSTFIVARDPEKKKIKLGGLGCLGVGVMWFDETPDHQSYAGYSEAPIEAYLRPQTK